MSILDTTICNTILVPTSDSLVDDHPRRYSEDAASDQEDQQEFQTDVQKKGKGALPKDVFRPTQFQVFLIYNNTFCLMDKCQSVTGLKIQRTVESKNIGGDGSYVVKLPGALSYQPVSFVHLTCPKEPFLFWLFNGTGQGGIQKADIVVRIGNIFTSSSYLDLFLRDAFPISWNIGDIEYKDQATGESTYFKVDNLTVAYGKLEFRTFYTGINMDNKRFR